MNIQLNGEDREIPDNSTAQELVEQLGLIGKRLAMEVNREIVPRSAYATTILKQGDEIEIVHAIYTPSKQEVRRAEAIVEEACKAKEKQLGILVVDGDFISPPTVRAAERLLGRHRAILSLEGADGK